MPNKACSRQFHQKKIMALFAVIIICVLCFFYIYESKREQSIFKDYQTQLKMARTAAVSDIITGIENSKNSVRYLSELPAIKKLVEDLSSNNSEENTIKNSKTLDEITETFIRLLKYTEGLIQARLILNDGAEYIRVDKNNSDIIVTPQNLLQSKKSRDYFQTAMTHTNGDIYISEITPNYEHSKLTYPLAPVYRAIKTLSAKDNNVIALLVLNFDAQLMLKKLNNALSQASPYIENYLIDSNGFYLAAPSTKILFGNNLGNQDANWFLHTNNQIALSKQDVFQTKLSGNKYLFSSQAIEFSNSLNAAPYYIFTGVPMRFFAKDIKRQRLELVVFSLIFICLSTLIIIFISQHLRKKALESTEKSQFKALITDSSDVILSVDSLGDIRDLNKASNLFFGLSNKDINSHNIFTLLHLNNTASFNSETLDKVILSNKKTQLKLETKTQFNTLRFLTLTLFPLKEESDKSDSVALIIKDITHERETQKKLESSNTELIKEVNRLAEELESTKQKVIHANKSKSIFIAYISHEIRTPLNSINGLLALAKGPEAAQKQQDYLKMAQVSTDSLNILINDILDFSKIESGKLELNPTEFNLKSLIEKVVSSSSFLIKQKNIEVIVDISRLEIEWFILDENRVKQILTNLLSNAIKYTSQGEVILTISTRISQDKPDMIALEIQVDDTGIGIPHDQQVKLFKPFIQNGESNTNRFNGTGLGLSISKQLCELMNGKLSLESEVGKGSTFKALLLSKESNRAKPAIQEEINIEQRNKPVAILVKSIHLNRILRKQFRAWMMQCVSFQKAKDMLERLPSLKPGFILLDDDFLNEELEKQLEEFNAIVIHLSPRCEALNTKENALRLSKPIMPTHLASLINQGRPNLPKEDTLTHKQPTKPAENAADLSYTSDLNKQTIFVVDDNEINRIVGAGILKTLPAKINTAINGQDLIQQLKALKPSKYTPLIFMDCQMPIMDGYQCTKSIRRGEAGEWLQDIPIIALTADAMLNNQLSCQKAGMNDFISKPFDTEKLIALALKWTKKNSNHL